MTESDKDIVSVLRLAIADRIGQDRFELWFGSATRITIQRAQVSIEVGSRFSLDWLRLNFRRDIEAVVQDKLGVDYGIEFRLNERLAPHRQPANHSGSGIPQSQKADCPNGVDSRNQQRQRKFTDLDSFVVGDCNRIGFTSTQVILRQLGSVSPLFIHGPTGTGKTHLLGGLIEDVQKLPGRKRSVYLTAEQFTTFFLEALHGKGLPSFRRRYRNVDLLVIDDVQFFSGKRATLEEILHTIDACLRDGRQMAFAADRPPLRLSGMGSELINRFSGGLACGLQPPDFETRLEILRRWCRDDRLEVPDSVNQLIANNLNDDVRQLRGALNRLIATSEALRCPIDETFAQQNLQDIFQAARRVVKLDDVERAICEVFHVRKTELKSSRRTKSISQPRMLAMWLARKYTRAALSEIGEHFGRRSHSTVVSAQKTVDRWIKTGQPIQMVDRDQQVEEAIRHIEARLRAG